MKLVITKRAETDLKRLHAFIADKNPPAAARIHDEILDALESLLEMPLRCPLADPDGRSDIRHMVIDAGSGYVAAFRVIPDTKGQSATVRVLAIRASAEAGL